MAAAQVGRTASTRVLVLGAGFGGLEVATRLCEQLPDAVDVVLVDQADGFVFGFSKLDVMFRQVAPAAVVHTYAGLARPGSRSCSHRCCRSTRPASRS